MWPAVPRRLRTYTQWGGDYTAAGFERSINDLFCFSEKQNQDPNQLSTQAFFWISNLVSE